MINDSGIPPEAILNPYTPMAFLPPEFANNFQISCYVYVAIMAAYTWDWLMAIPEEYTIVRNAGITAPNIAYFLSRVGTFGSSLGAFLSIVPLDNCGIVKYIESGFAVIALPATSLLFFFRLKAVYWHSKIIIIIFGIFWLVIAGLSILLIFGVNTNHIPYTRYCFQDQANIYIAIPILFTAVNDTLVFLAISYRMTSFAMVKSTWRARTKSFFTGDGLYYLSKVLLQSGQVYYFVTIGAAIVASILIFCVNISVELRTILVRPYFSLESAMACRVFRVVFLGVTQEDTSRSSTSNPHHRDAANDKMDRSHKFEIFAAMENTATKFNREYPFGEGKLTGDDLQ